MVHFVGAGSGAPDLITVRGQRLIESADVIIYAGSLINAELLAAAKPGCKIHNSAKMTLDEVISVIRSADRDGLEVVRLHTGDPCVYGAVREQYDRLEELGIAYDICPGVSSFCGAAAAVGAEYTLPDISQTVILTRMAGRTKVPESENIESLAAHGASMVIFLSAGMTEELSARLIKGGCPPDTPAAIIYKATWADEKVLRCTVSTLPETAAVAGITKTALILIGNFLSKTAAYSTSKLYDPMFETEYRTKREIDNK